MPVLPMLVLLRPSQGSQFECHSHFWLVFRRNNGVLILREPKREIQEEGGGRVGLLRSLLF